MTAENHREKRKYYRIKDDKFGTDVIQHEKPAVKDFIANYQSGKATRNSKYDKYQFPAAEAYSDEGLMFPGVRRSKSAQNLDSLTGKEEKFTKSCHNLEKK